MLSVTVTPTVRAQGNIAVGATKLGSPFRLTLPASWEAGVPIDLRIRVSFVGSLSPQVTTASLPTGQPTDEVTDVAYAGPPVPLPSALVPVEKWFIATPRATPRGSSSPTRREPCGRSCSR